MGQAKHFAIVVPISAGEAATCTPAALRAVIFSVAPAFTARDDRPCMPHYFPRRSCLPRDESRDRFFDIIFDEFRSYDFRITTYLADQNDTCSVGVVLEHNQEIDKIRTDDLVTSDTDAGRLTEITVSGLPHCLVGKGTGFRNNADTSRFMHMPPA